MLDRIPFQRRIPFLRARRIVAIDPGHSTLKLVLVESAFSRVRVVRYDSVELQEEGLISPEDVQRQLHSMLRELDYDQIALVLPQHRSLSQVIDVAESGDQSASIQNEIVRLSGLSGSAIVHDHARLNPFGKYQNPYWITLSQESEVLAQIARLDLQDVCEVTNSGNALAAACHDEHSNTPSVIIADLGAVTTTVAVLLEGQAVFANAFALGSDHFTEAIAQLDPSRAEDAELRKRGRNLLHESSSGGQPLQTAVTQWADELQRMLRDWAKDHPELTQTIGALPALLCGGGALQPGLIEFLNGHTPFRFTPWTSSTAKVPDQFVVAYGTALHALARAPQAASLLPPALEERAQQQRFSQRLQFANFSLILVVALALAAGTWNKLTLLNQKNALLADAHAALAQAKSADQITGDIAKEYETLRPILERQRQTLDHLNALSALQQVQTNQNFWFVLVADQASYFTAPEKSTNTNQSPVLDASTRTNPPLAKYGLIAEVCLPQEGEAMRLALSHLVTRLRQAPTFKNVDTLPSMRKRDLIDPKLALPDHQFALALDFHENEFQQPIAPREKSPLPPLREPRANPRTFRQKAERTD